LPEEISSAEYMAFDTFVLSPDHWQEEIETVKKWAETVRKLSPVIYARFTGKSS